MKKVLYIIMAAMSLFIVTSCISDDFTYSPNDVLSFSVDTVTFDTVITAQGTTTKQFVVYNKNKKQLNISSIKVGGVSDAKFYINVDGMKGREFHDIEVRGEDSIYVFVEGFINEQKADAPKEYNDYIEFETNGVTQKVVLNAWGQDVIRFVGDTIYTDTQLYAKRPYLVYDTLVVAPGVNLNLEAGTTLLFHKGGALKVYGTMTAVGTQDKPITLRGDRLDNVVSDIDFDIMSGQWGGVLFGEGSYNNHWEFVDMGGSEFGVQINSSNPSRETLYMLNCRLHNSSGSILTAWNAGVTAFGTELADAADGIVNLMGGKTHMAHCTIANYYLFKIVEEPLLNVFNIDGNYPEIKADIDNCIFYGLTSDINAGDLTGTEIYLRNCLLKSDGTDDYNFINIVWKGDPKFYTVRDKYIFDYRLKPESDAIARGDKSLTPDKARYDRYGQDRYAEAAPSIGAYVYVEPEDK
ncbi:MAG: hypothetical protein KBT13_11000 [Bacteroidales bacterium]|nr:hypothetical protein [Candidatus Sodaliphilus limicaballi]